MVNESINVPEECDAVVWEANKRKIEELRVR